VLCAELRQPPPAAAGLNNTAGLPPLALQDYLHAASDNTALAGRSLAHFLRSARRAWQQRQQAAAPPAGGGDGSNKENGGGGGGGGGQPTSAAFFAEFLAALNEGQQGEQQAPMGLQLFNSQLSDWLLERAAAPLADPAEQQAIQRYLSAVLRREDSAEALLQRPGAAPRLLRLAAQSPALQQLLGGAVQRTAPPREVPLADAQAVLQQLAAAQQQRQAAAVAAGEQQQQLLLGLQLLAAWAAASAANATQLAEAGAGAVLTDLAASSGTGVDGMQSLIAQVR
jgi:hypothetical protein